MILIRKKPQRNNGPRCVLVVRAKDGVPRGWCAGGRVRCPDSGDSSRDSTSLKRGLLGGPAVSSDTRERPPHIMDDNTLCNIIKMETKTLCAASSAAVKRDEMISILLKGSFRVPAVRVSSYLF